MSVTVLSADTAVVTLGALWKQVVMFESSGKLRNQTEYYLCGDVHIWGGGMVKYEGNRGKTFNKLN